MYRNLLKAFVRRQFHSSKLLSKPSDPCQCPPEPCPDVHGKASMWRMLSLVAILGCAGFGAYTLTTMDHPHRHPYIPYDYMYIRSRKYPWGDGVKTLFHNPDLNALPGIGFEDRNNDGYVEHEE